jgi:superoxide dismutase, Cu-Zn family
MEVFMKKSLSVIAVMLILSILFLITVTCKSNMKEKKEIVEIKKAIVVLTPAEKSKVKGTITFMQEENGVKITGEIMGLTPGEHGFHIHEFGNISDVKGISAGGHFNPSKMKHGSPMDKERHEGDLGNITADKSGTVHLELTDSMIKLNGENSIIGRSVVVHAGKDDFITQPTGNSGDRIAFGVIGIAKNE